MNPVEIIAHRGANREAPENTIPAFERALAIGVQGIELDVHLSKDGVPVVHHDPLLHDGSDFHIARLNARELRRRTVPTLEEVIAVVNGQCKLYVEIKAPSAVAAVAGLVREHASWCSVHSFDHRVSLQIKALAPPVPTGILLVSYLVDIGHAIRAAHARDVWQQAEFIDREVVERAHQAGARVIAWTVNSPIHAELLYDLGVDAICSDRPRDLLAGLSESRG